MSLWMASGMGPSLQKDQPRPKLDASASSPFLGEEQGLDPNLSDCSPSCLCDERPTKTPQRWAPTTEGWSTHGVLEGARGSAPLHTPAPHVSSNQLLRELHFTRNWTSKLSVFTSCHFGGIIDLRRAGWSHESPWFTARWIESTRTTWDLRLASGNRAGKLHLWGLRQPSSPSLLLIRLPAGGVSLFCPPFGLPKLHLLQEA